MMNTKIRVLNVLPMGTVGGAEKYIHSLCRHHDKSRFDVMACVLFSSGTVSRQIEDEGNSVEVLNMANGFDFFRAAKLTFLIRKQRIDIVNIHGQNPLGKLFCTLGHPWVIVNTDHGTSINSPIVRRKRVVLFNRILTPFFDHNIAISKGMIKSLQVREKVPLNKMSLIYNGVDIDAISKTTIDKAEFKKALNIKLGVPVLGTVGRLAPEKEYPKLLEALSILLNQGVEFITLIIGDGPQRGYLENLSIKMNLDKHVRFIGQRQDVYQLLELIDIFVFSSGGEAFSITLLEAMAKSKPVVAFDVDGVNEAVISGDTGFLVPYGDMAGFVEKIKLLIQSPELISQMGKAAFQRVSSSFNLKKNIKKLEALYEMLLEKKME